MGQFRVRLTNEMADITHGNVAMSLHEPDVTMVEGCAPSH